MKTTNEMISSVFERKNNYEKKRKARRLAMIKGVSITCSICLVLTLAAIGTMQLINVKSDESYRILIDVNPSIELCANEKDVVIETVALNSDGEKILKETDTEGKTIGEAVKDISKTMIDFGYISDEANSILVSVDGLPDDREQDIKDDISKNISDSMSDKKVEGDIILQTLSENNEFSQIAETYSISAGKAQLISQIIAQNKSLTYEELSSMSIHELNVLKVSHYTEMEDTNETNQPEYIEYIGQSRAEEIALTDANITAKTINTRLDYHKGTMVYCVEFENDTHKYRYNINSVTGEIITGEKSELDKDDFFKGDAEVAFVGENAALNAALAHAGMEDSILIRCKYNRDWVDGTSIYNLYFTDGLAAGKYIVNARTGEIMQSSKTQEPKDRSVKANVIGESTAKRIALAKDGLIDGNVSKYEMKLVVAEDSYTYELMFICNGIKYNAQIDAMDGTILNFEKLSVKDTGKASAEVGNSSEK